MPISFSVANHQANPVQLTRQQRDGLTAMEILSMSSADTYKGVTEVLQSSLCSEASDAAAETSTDASGRRRDLTSKIHNLIPRQNGFIDTLQAAYGRHHALALRPDDVWMMILIQFNYFVNANSELLRASFVAHEDKQELIVSDDSLDFGAMSRRMMHEVEKNVVDPSLHDWLLPNFSTTTVNDTTVSAVLVMATFKKYFSYFMAPICGIPRVTLEGEKSDWADILRRLEKLKEYGIYTIAWYHLLYPVISRFVAAFDAPESSENVDFWQCIVEHNPGGCGQSRDFYSGWITAFYVFNDKGVWIGDPLDLTASSTMAPQSMTSKQFWATYLKPSPSFHNFPARWGKPARWKLALDDTTYHFVDRHSMPPGCAEVDVKVRDRLGNESNCVMTAGMVGTKVFSSGDTTLSATGTNDTVRPVSGWWMFEKKERPPRPLRGFDL